MMIALRLLAILLLCNLALSDIPPNTESTPDPTILCPSMCAKFTANSNTFTSEIQMAKNFTKVIFSAKNHLDIIKALGSYTSSYKLKNIQNLMGLKLLQEYGDQLIEKFGEENLNQYIDQRYSGSSCEPCQDDIVSYAESVGVSVNLLEQETIADNLDDEASKPLILLPYNTYPNYPSSRRLLQPGITYDCLDNSEGRVQQYDCFYKMLRKNMEKYYYTHLNIHIFEPSRNNNILEQETNVFDFESGSVTNQVSGLPALIFNKNHRKMVLDSYFNCNMGIYQTNCN